MKAKWLGIFGLFILTGCMFPEEFQKDMEEGVSNRIMMCMSECDDIQAHELPPELYEQFCSMKEGQLREAGATNQSIELFVSACQKKVDEIKNFDYNTCIKRCVE